MFVYDKIKAWYKTLFVVFYKIVPGVQNEAKFMGLPSFTACGKIVKPQTLHQLPCIGL